MLEPMDKGQIESLRLVYMESGQQLRNNASTRNTLASFIVVGLGAFFGLVAQHDGGLNDGLNKEIWYLPAFLGLLGAANVLALWPYTRVALQRQRQITTLLLARDIRNQVVGLTAPLVDGRPRWKQAIDPHVWWDRRLELFFLYVVYVPICLASVEFSLWGDPFGLAKQTMDGQRGLMLTAALYLGVPLLWIPLYYVNRWVWTMVDLRRHTRQLLAAVKSKRGPRG